MDPTTPRKLLDIPKEILVKIVEYTEIEDVQRLRKVSRGLRALVDNNKINIPLRVIVSRLTLESSSILIPKNCINYSETRSGCLVSSRKNKILKNARMLDIVFNDLELILKHQWSPIRELLVLGDRPEVTVFNEKVINYLMTRNQRLQVEKVNISVQDQYDIIRFFSCFDENYLKSLSIDGKPPLTRRETQRGFDLSEVVATEQWRRLSDFHLNGGSEQKTIISTPIAHFLHFANVSIKKETVSLEELVELREAFRPPTSSLKSFEIWFPDVFKVPRSIIDQFGKCGYDEEAQGCAWWFRAPDYDRVLRVRIFWTPRGSFFDFSLCSLLPKDYKLASD